MCTSYKLQYAHRWLLNVYPAIQIINQINHSIILTINRSKSREQSEEKLIAITLAGFLCSTNSVWRVNGIEKNLSTLMATRIIIRSSSSWHHTYSHRRHRRALTRDQQSKMVNAFCIVLRICEVHKRHQNWARRRHINLKRRKNIINVQFHSNCLVKMKNRINVDIIVFT